MSLELEFLAPPPPPQVYVAGLNINLPTIAWEGGGDWGVNTMTGRKHASMQHFVHIVVGSKRGAWQHIVNLNINRQMPGAPPTSPD